MEELAGVCGVEAWDCWGVGESSLADRFAAYSVKVSRKVGRFGLYGWPGNTDSPEGGRDGLFCVIAVAGDTIFSNKGRDGLFCVLTKRGDEGDVDFVEVTLIDSRSRSRSVGS